MDSSRPEAHWVEERARDTALHAPAVLVLDDVLVCLVFFRRGCLTLERAPRRKTTDEVTLKMTSSRASRRGGGEVGGQVARVGRSRYRRGLVLHLAGPTVATATSHLLHRSATT